MAIIPRKKNTGRPGTYPWNQWLSMSKFTLIKGVHYHGTRTCNMMIHIRRKVKERGLKAKMSTNSEEDRIFVELYHQILIPVGSSEKHTWKKGRVE